MVLETLHPLYAHSLQLNKVGITTTMLRMANNLRKANPVLVRGNRSST